MAGSAPVGQRIDFVLARAYECNHALRADRDHTCTGNLGIKADMKARRQFDARQGLFDFGRFLRILRDDWNGLHCAGGLEILKLVHVAGVAWRRRFGPVGGLGVSKRRSGQKRAKHRSSSEGAPHHFLPFRDLFLSLSEVTITPNSALFQRWDCLWNRM
jgi:hypothetical protein